MVETIVGHLHALAQWPAGRPVGSPANHATENYLAGALEAAGYAVERQSFDCIDWQVDGVELWAGDGPLPAAANPYSPATDVTARLAAVATLDELDQADLAGRIALLHGALTTEPLFPRNFPFFTVPEHQRVYDLLEEKGVLAVVCVSPSATRPAPIIEDGDFSLPSVTVAAGVGESLLATSEAVRLRVRSRSQPGHAANVIGRLGRATRDKLVLCAHFDTKPGTPGALDNAAGVAAVLELAARLPEGNPAHNLEVIFFNGEDHYASPGEVAYINGCGSEFGRIALVVNIDGLGLRDAPVTLAFFGVDEAWADGVRAAVAGRSGLSETKRWPQGDHMIFAMRGVPCLAVTSGGIHTLVDSVLHTPDDTLELLDPLRIASAVDFLASLLSRDVLPQR